MITTRFCSQCQQPLSVDAPAGLCPQCLMKAASGPPPTAAGDGLEAELIDIADPTEVAKKLPQFEILELLGRGGMGVVYKARQLNLDRIVALKILPPLDAQSPDFVARFTREARALAKLNHPNIVNVYDFGETGGLYWIIMEFVDGANLRQLFQTRKLTSAEALAIVPKICDALQYAHEEGLVHRDIKPENLLIDKKGRVKIADFGLAKLLRREPLDMTLTLSGMALGTLRYMAPEQMDKPETVDHRADLYSLGVVIYEMLTGETPVGRYELPSQKAQVDVRFDEIVLHALEREPDRRYQHASQVREDVEKVTSTVGAKAAAMPASQSPNDAEDAGEDGEAEHSVFTAWGGRIIALAAVLLAFFNPWGPKAWYFFAACCAIFGVLASFGIGRRRTSPPQLPNTGITGTTTADWQGKLQLAAIGLLLAGIADAVGGCIWIGSSVDALTDAMQHGAPLGWLIAKALGAVCGSFATVYYTIGSALFLLHRNDDGDITFPLVMAAIVPPGCVFGLPAAIYALVLLSKPEVKALFPLPSPGSDATPPANNIQPGAKNTTGKSRHLLSAFLVLLCLGGFFFGLSFQAKTGGTAAGVTEIITVGAVDPIFVKESGPSGFQTGLNFVSWSFFAVVVAGISLGALWRIGREGQGKVPRDPAWWRDWWKQVGVWGGLLLTVCIVRTVMDPAKVLQPPGDRTVQARFNKAPATSSVPAPDHRFNVQQDRAQLPATLTPGRKDYAFKFSGAANHTLNVWLEVWRNGKLEIVEGFDFLARPKMGAPLEASLRLTTMNGENVSVESAGKVRFDWTMNCGGTNGTGETAGAWRPDIFKDLGSINSTWDYPPKEGWHPRPGETVTVLAIVGYRLTSLSEFVPGWSEAELLKGWPNSAVLIRARFNPARAGELGEGPGLGGNVTDREFLTKKIAQFALGKQLATDLAGHRSLTEAHAALVAAASTPEGRARATQMVKEFTTGDMGYTTALAPVIGPVRDLKYRIDKASAEELVSTLEKFITDLTNLPPGTFITWDQPRPIEMGPTGPQLTADTIRKLKLPQRQADEANKVMQKYAGEAHALERRHTKITKNDKGHVLVTIEPFSDECLELARKMVAELGGIVPQDILPAIRPGALPGEIFRSAGECRHTIELWKEDGKYFREHSQSDWVAAPGMVRDNMSSSSNGPKMEEVFYGDYRLYWTEE